MKAMNDIRIDRLQQNQIAQAYPLIRGWDKDCTLAQWTCYAERLTRLPADQCGILIVQNASHCLHGLVSYEIESKPPQHRCLVINHFIIVDLLVESIGPELVDIINVMSDTLNCTEININLSNLPHMGLLVGSSTPTSLLTRAGFKPETITLKKNAPSTNFI